MSKPTHLAYSVRDYEKDGKKDSFWSKVGVAFEHKDGKGFDINLDAFPVTGRVVLRVNDGKKQPGEADPA
jgi:hypothetical protein